MLDSNSPCRNSHPPHTTGQVLQSYSAVPQLMQAFVKLSPSHWILLSSPPPKAAASFILVSIGPGSFFSLQSIVCSKIRGICQMKDGTGWSREILWLAPLDWPIPALLASWPGSCARGFLHWIVRTRRVSMIINQEALSSC